MAYIFNRAGETINPAEQSPAESIASESGKGVRIKSSSTIALASNGFRYAATFVNDSDQPIYLTLGPRAAMNSGIRLNALGGSYEINSTNLYRGPISAICTSGGKNLCITELSSIATTDAYANL